MFILRQPKETAATTATIRKCVGAAMIGRRPPPAISPPSSPGVTEGHYAGCKWTAPPLPSALPPPPQHWMMAPPQGGSATLGAQFHHGGAARRHRDAERQLKVLLKVQA